MSEAHDVRGAAVIEQAAAALLADFLALPAAARAPWLRQAPGAMFRALVSQGQVLADFPAFAEVWRTVYARLLTRGVIGWPLFIVACGLLDELGQEVTAVPPEVAAVASALAAVPRNPN